MASTKHLLLIFIRNPELGKCKTRLAARIGDQNALDLYKFLLLHTHHVTKGSRTDKLVCYSDYMDKNDIWEDPEYQKTTQTGKDLGERMANAFRNGFERGYNKIIIIGSDMYDLNAEDLEEAFNALEKHEYVIGPATDGGYYLLGMNAFDPSLFRDKPWGTDKVLKNTLKDLHGKKYVLLTPKNDIDIYEDIRDLEVFRPFLT